jgi:hypothetical protein
MDKSRSHDELAWREALMKELSRRKIPLAWQARLMEELNDHHSDLMEESMNATTQQSTSPEERLGAPQEIAAAAVAEYRRLGFFARRPLLTYVALPIVATPAVFVVCSLVIMLPMAWGLEGVEYLLGSERDPVANLVMNTLVATAVNAMRFVPFAILAWWFCRLARRHGRGWRCVMSACGVAAVYAAIISINMRLRTELRPGALWTGFAIPPQDLMNWLQAAVPLAIGAVCVWRSSAGDQPRQASVNGDDASRVWAPG